MFSGRMIWLAYFVVFVSSTCGLVIEIVAGRIMAPYIGVSLYTWTSIIGIVLAGISLGNFLGGRVADRRASSNTLGIVFLAASLSSAGIIVLAPVIAGSIVSTGLQFDVAPKILLITLATFFLPSLVLGMVSPIVVKLALQDLNRSGNTVGSIYAVSTMGSIFGTFVTGFWLISWLGTRLIVLLVALVLLAMAVWLGRVWSLRPKMIVVSTLFVACLLLATANALGISHWSLPFPGHVLDSFNLAASVVLPAYTVLILLTTSTRGMVSAGICALAVGLLLIGWGAGDYLAPCEVESNYFCIRATDQVQDGQLVRSVTLDRLVHSMIQMNDPTALHYGYEQVMAELTRLYAADHPKVDSMFIGGGGYAFPRYMEAIYPNSAIDVVEIDPAVTRFAGDRLGLSTTTRIHSFNLDARTFLENRDESARYDLIYGDAFNDFSVPFHLTTVEFDRVLARRLKPAGIYLANVIDTYQRGEFAKAFVNSLARVFPHVYLCAFSGPELVWKTDERFTFVVMASQEPFDPRRFQEVVGDATHSKTIVLPDADLRAYLKTGRALTLTDDFVPVDQLLAPVFARGWR